MVKAKTKRRPARGPSRDLPRRRAQWREADHAARLALIIDTALDLLHHQGIAQVTMRRVAARLGVGAMTLYTYVDGQDQLRREMIRRGFQMLSSHCRSCQEPSMEPHSWAPGARSYLQFAAENPNLYRLMFSTPSATHEDLEIAREGYTGLLERVRGVLANSGLKGDQLRRLTALRAGLYWIALHGLASLIIDERLGIIGENQQVMLDELLARIAPG